MKFSYYPGCVMHGTAVEFGMSTLATCRTLGIDIVEIPDWNCCGALEVYPDMYLELALSARNAAIAEETGYPMMTTCAICFHNVSKAYFAVNESENAKDMINDALGDMKYEGKEAIRHLLDILVSDYGLENVTAKVKRSLDGLKVAPFYGCLLARPKEIARFDDPENPQFLDRLIGALGAEAVPFEHKMKCCGGSLLMSREDLAHHLSREILEEAVNVGADCLVITCPMCNVLLDLQQKEIEKRYGITLNMPVLYFTQLIGLALGHKPKELGLDKNMVSTAGVLKKLGVD